MNELPGARLLALALHRALEALAVDRELTLAGEILDEVERHAERVVEPERVLARHDARAGRGAVEDLLEPRQPGRQHGVEPVLLAADDAHDVVAPGAQLRIGVAHLGDEHVDERVQDRLDEAELLAVPHRAAHDLAQHVAAPLVRRHDAVGDEERHGAQVIGDDAHRDVGGLRRASRRSAGRRVSPIAVRMGVKRSVS